MTDNRVNNPPSSPSWEICCRHIVLFLRNLLFQCFHLATRELGCRSFAPFEGKHRPSTGRRSWWRDFRVSSVCRRGSARHDSYSNYKKWEKQAFEHAKASSKQQKDIAIYTRDATGARVPMSPETIQVYGMQSTLYHRTFLRISCFILSKKFSLSAFQNEAKWKTYNTLTLRTHHTLTALYWPSNEKIQ